MVGSHFALAQTVDSSGLYGGAENKSALTTFFAKFGMGTDDPRIIAARLIQVLLGFLGLIAVSLVMYAGWLYMTAAGEEKKIEDAKNILKNAGIGLLIIFSAFGIVSFIISSILGVTDSADQGANYGEFNYAGGGGGAGFYVASVVPRNKETNVFRNDLPTFEFNIEMSAGSATTSNFSLKKLRTYELQGSEREISLTTASTTCTVNCDIPFKISTSTYRIVSLVATNTCSYSNGAATTTYEHCLEPWTEYQFEVKTSVLTSTGLTLLCSTQNPCLATFTTNDSMDTGRPVITSISPIGGFCRNQDNEASSTEACLSNDDCQHWNSDHTAALDKNNTCDTETPNAKAGNLITFSGRHFGNIPGEIYVIASSSITEIKHEATTSSDGTPITAYTEDLENWGGASLATTTISGCPSTWNDNEIIAMMPSGFNVGSTTAFKIVEHTTGDNWYDSTEDRFGSKIKRLLVNKIDRPGLCQLTPNSGSSSARFSYQGLNLFQTTASTTGYFGSIYDKTLAYRGIFNNTSINIDGLVPSIHSGTTTVFALSDKTYGNYLNFAVLPEVYSGPRITGFTPTAGQAGQYVTITGTGFGYATLEQLKSFQYGVFFATSSNVSGSDVGIEASYDFPDMCAGNLWTDKQIIVKLPAGLTNASQYMLRLIYPDTSATSTYFNILSNAYVIDNSEPDLNSDNTINSKSIKRQFTANTSAKLSPGLCKVEPAVGQADQAVKLFGEYFPASTTLGNVVFSRQATSTATAFSVSDKTSVADAVVSKSAITGQVAVSHSTNGASNALSFKVGACEPSTNPSSECGNDNWFCCPNGSPYVKTCRQASSTIDQLQNACFTSIKLSAYEWSFSTALDELKATCSGYTNFNSCMLSSSCPNTPGECQSGNGRSSGDCTDASCEASNPDLCQGGSCTYNASLNSCQNSQTSCSPADNILFTESNKLTFGSRQFYNVKCTLFGTSTKFYQIDMSGGNCPTGSFLDMNGLCTIGTPLVKASCDQACNQGFACKSNKCVIDQPVCQVGSTCQSGQCKKEFTCECCCKVEKPEETCCTGLKCRPNLCVNTATSSTAKLVDGNPEGYVYGQCTGCKVLVGGVYNKEASDNSCNCKAGAADRYCNVDEKVFVNGDWINNTDGICQDAAQENQPCRATAGSDATTNTSSTVVATSTVEVGYWMSTSEISEYPQFRDNPGIVKYLFVDEPQSCSVPGETMTKDGLSAVCMGASGSYYWVATTTAPCPSGTFMSTMSGSANSYCLFATSTADGLPKTCTNFSATSTVKQIFGGADSTEIVCEKITVWQKPFSTYYIRSTTTTTNTYIKGSLVGNVAYHWQAAYGSGCSAGTYLDNNGQCTLGQLNDMARCNLTSAPRSGMVANSTSTCKTVINSSEGYWMIPKVPGKNCPFNTALAATSTDNKPWCIIGAKPTSLITVSATSSILCNDRTVGQTKTTAGKSFTCQKINYTGTNALGNEGFCSDANLPTCAAGLFCDPNGCTCQQVSTTTQVSEVRAGELCIDTGAGGQCLVGADSCDSQNTSLHCLTNPSASDCRCCCNPGIFNASTKAYTGWDVKTIFDVQGNSKELRCTADKGLCSGGSRGAFCGCATDFECNGGGDSCGLDTCCRARPYGTSTVPSNNSENNCRNSVISMEFNESMDPSSFSGNIIVVSDNETEACPTGSYLTTIESRHYSWLDRLFLWARHMFNASDTAYAEIGHNYCTVEGAVTMSAANKKMDFAPKKLLDQNRWYYMIVRGDASSSDALHEGVLSAFNTGIHDTDGGTGTTQLTPGYALSSGTFNGVNYFGYIWKFKTKPDSAENEGVCLLDHISINTDGKGGESWLFKSLNKNTKDDKAMPANTDFDKDNSDNDKVYYGQAFDKNNKLIVSVDGSYEWDWSWESANPLVATTGPLGTYDLSPNSAEQQIVAQPGSPDRQTIINAKVTVVADGFGSTVGQEKTASAIARIFLCNNPWPPVVDEATWPWRDESANCAFNATNCQNNQFEFYYCRDNGQADFPAVNNNQAMPIGGLANGACDAGFKNKSTCIQSSDCLAPGSTVVKTCVAGKCAGDDGTVGGSCQSNDECQYDGTCRQVYKEFYFMRDALPASDDLSLSATPDPKGSSVSLTWIADLTMGSYNLYYGLSSQKYGKPIVISGGSQSSYILKNLDNNKKYYFAMTKVSAASKAESTLSAEAVALVSDKWAPNAPVNLSGNRDTDGGATISWDNSELDNNGDAKKFKVYYVASSTDLMTDYAASVALNANSTGKYALKINNTYLNAEVPYKFTVTAVDSNGNESEKVSSCNLNCGLVGQCQLNCKWTKQSGIIQTLGDVNGDGTNNSYANAVVYDLDNNYSTVANVPNGSYLKLSGIQPTQYAWLADVNSNEVVKFRVTNGPKKTCQRNSANGFSSCSVDNSVQEKIGQSLGRFGTGGTSPSRTAVNVETGDVWVHNRNQQTISQLTNEGQLLRTCNIDPGVNTGGGNGGGVTLDKDGNAWAANMYTGAVSLFSATAPIGDCTMLKTVNIGKQIYGLAIDSKGYLWAQSCPWCTSGQITRINTNENTPTYKYYDFSGSGSIYGITADDGDNVWFGSYTGDATIGGIYRYSTKTDVVKYYDLHRPITGVTSDSFGRIWGSGYAGQNIVGLNYNTGADAMSVLYSINTGWTMHGISGTSDGLIFSVAYPDVAGAGHVVFVDAATGQTTSSQLDRGTNIFCAKSSDNSGLGTCGTSFIYTYADMAGLNRAKVMRSGTWVSEVMDAGATSHWGTISWDQRIKQGSNSSVEVYVAADNDQNLLDGKMFIASDWNNTSYLNANHEGRYLKIKVVLKSSDPGVTPVVSNIRIK